MVPTQYSALQSGDASRAAPRALGAVASSTDAVFNPEAGYEPLRLSRTLPFLLRRAGAPFPRPRAKNGGPLQAVPVMARAMAEARIDRALPVEARCQRPS
jgi:hypothetical protein